MGLRPGAGNGERSGPGIGERERGQLLIQVPPRVLLGVAGGIAAYKAPEVLRRLREAGCEVRCALTSAAESFVAPLTLEVLSGHRVHRNEWLLPNGSGEELHVEAAKWARVLLFAPATARRLAGLAAGWAADFLDTVALVFRGPIVVAPAMHEAMWEHPAVRQHVDALERRGVTFVGPGRGALASGEVGWGRLAEPDDIVRAVLTVAAAGSEFAGVRALITAGPTREPIDPVRYLSNRSSGKMGFAIAGELAARGAEVVLVAGPVSLTTPPGVRRIDVETAEEMAARVREEAPRSQLCILSAAVSDFRASRVSETKIKRGAGPPQLELELNPDILASLSSLAPQAFRVGFAAEVGDFSSEARRKLQERDVHWMIANDVSRSDIGFESDANEVVVYRRRGEPIFFSRRSKHEVARGLVEALAEELRFHGITPTESSSA